MTANLTNSPRSAAQFLRSQFFFERRRAALYPAPAMRARPCMGSSGNIVICKAGGLQEPQCTVLELPYELIARVIAGAASAQETALF